METRLRMSVLLIGSLLVLATFTYPLWRPAPPENIVEDEFPELAEELRDAFSQLPPRVQQDYLIMRQRNAPMTTALVTARLRPPEPLPLEAQEMPDVSAASVIARGDFGPLRLSQDEISRGERELPPFSHLYGSVGEVTLYQFPDRRKLLWIEDLQVVNGPNLKVMLSTNANPFTFEEMGVDYIDLGELINPSGSQGYSVPAELNAAAYNSVVIVDDTYNIVFSVAPLR